MSVRIHCPFCDQKYDLDDFKEGVEVECAKCSQKFTLEMSLIDTTGEVKANNSAPRVNRDTPQPPASRNQIKENTVASAKANNPKKPSDAAKPRRMLSLLLAIGMFIGSVIAFINGCDRIGYSPYRSTYHDEYDYYGDLIPHLHYKASLKQLEEMKEIRYYLHRQTEQQKALLYFIVSACLFAGASIVTAVRETTSALVKAMDAGNSAPISPKDKLDN